MRPEDLIDAIGMIKDEYIEEAAPEQIPAGEPDSTGERVISFPEREMKEPRGRTRKPGWKRYGSFAAAAALLIMVLGVTGLAGNIGTGGSKNDSGEASGSSAVSTDTVKPSNTEQEGSQKTDGGPEGYSAPGGPEKTEGAESTEGEDVIVNPLEEIDKEIMASEDGVNVTLPEGAEEVRWFRYDTEPLIDEIRFIYEGREVYFRAQTVDQATGSPLSIESFTGLFYDWDGGVHEIYDNDKGGFYISVDASEGAEVLYWYSPDGRYIFSLSLSDEEVDDVEECKASLKRIYDDIEIEV